MKTNTQPNSETRIQDTAHRFKSNIETSGRLIQVHDSHSRHAVSELAAKPWPGTITEQITTASYPILVVIKTDFAPFTPANIDSPDDDDWRIIWISWTRKPTDEIPRLSQAMERSLSRNTESRNTDLFAFLDSITDARTGLSDYGAISSPTNPDARPPQQKIRNGGWQGDAPRNR